MQAIAEGRLSFADGDSDAGGGSDAGGAPVLSPKHAAEAQAAGITPQLVRGLSRQRQRNGGPPAAQQAASSQAFSGSNIVRSISGTSLHSLFFKVGE